MQKDKSVKFKLPISEWKALHDHLVDAYDYILNESRHIDDMVTVLSLEEIMLRLEKKFLDWEHQGLMDRIEKTIKYSWIDYIAILKSNCIDTDPFTQNVLHKMILAMPPEISDLLK